uniref:SSD domain-containing protein n=1 Tax=Globodera pallida TaxID=36090 RepID=A0A183C9M6_GLOPA
MCIIASAICGVKMLKTKVKNQITGYTPPDLASKFYSLREVVEVDNLVRHNLTFYNQKHDRDESFSMICHFYCNVSEPVQLFYTGFLDQHDRAMKNEPLNDRIKLDYPFSLIMGRKVNLQPNFYGVHISKTNKPKFGNMDKIEAIVIRYRAEKIKGWSDDEISEYENTISSYFEKNYASKKLRVLVMTSSNVQEEINRTGDILRSFIGMGVAVMIVCSMLTTSMSSSFMRQFSIYRLPVAVFACICPFMACATALGSLFFLGLRNGSILGVTPFLIIAIGIDDAFLTIHSWQLTIKKKRKSGELKIPSNSISLDKLLAELLAEVLEETGPAILISALTNITSDLVGMWTGSPEITLLCIGNIASIALDFFYQITLFTAVLIICARWEFNAELKAIENNNSSNSISANGTIASADSNSDEHNATSFRSNFIASFERVANGYIKIVCNIFASMFIVAISAVFFVICFKAVLGFEINLTMVKLFPPDSLLLEVDNYREEKLMPFYTMAQIFVNNPGDLSNATRRHKLNELIVEMEHLPYAYPSESSIYFPRAFEAFESFSPDDEQQQQIDQQEPAEEEPSSGNNNSNSTKALSLISEPEERFEMDEFEDFLNWPEYNQYRGLVKSHKNGTKTVVDSFMAIVTYHGMELKEWYERAVMMQHWRRVTDKYVKEFNVSVLHDDGLFLDLLENMPTDIWQSAVGTLVCMSIICAVFMNFNPFVVVVTSIVIASILIETLGIMALTGMSIDPVVMAAVIISMGFSVDIPAHVSYHFHIAKWSEDGQRQRTIEERVRMAFAAVGFPAVQASTCTNICIMCLLIVPVYMAQVFVRILCTCITLCTIHSLCLLPALFNLLGTLEAFLCSKFS